MKLKHVTMHTLTALATLIIGIIPERFIELVNWSLGLAQTAAVAKLIR